MANAPKPPFPQRRQALRVGMALAFGSCLGAAPAMAAVLPGGRELRVLMGADSATTRQILQLLKGRYPALVADADLHALDARKGSALYVALGPQAMRRVWVSDLKSPAVAGLTSSQLYRQLLASEGPGMPEHMASAVFADAPALAPLQLIAAIFERRVTVGVLLSEASAYMERPLRQAAAQTGLDLAVAQVETGSDPVRSLTRLGNIQVLLAVPDGALYTPDALRAVLESSYRRSLPVVGFSAATVAAGTLATAYCAADDVAADLIELIDAWTAQGGGNLPEPRYARYWRVAVNDTVARSMGLPLSDKVRNLGNAPGGRPA
jgi:hypothetical protein